MHVLGYFIWIYIIICKNLHKFFLYFVLEAVLQYLIIIIFFRFLLIFLINFPTSPRLYCSSYIVAPFATYFPALLTRRTFNNLHSSPSLLLRSFVFLLDSSLDLRAYQQLAPQLKFAIFNCQGNAISQRLSPTLAAHKKRLQLRLYGFRYEFHHSPFGMPSLPTSCQVAR